MRRNANCRIYFEYFIKTVACNMVQSPKLWVFLFFRLWLWFCLKLLLINKTKQMETNHLHRIMLFWLTANFTSMWSTLQIFRGFWFYFRVLMHTANCQEFIHINFIPIGQVQSQTFDFRHQKTYLCLNTAKCRFSKGTYRPVHVLRTMV